MPRITSQIAEEFAKALDLDALKKEAYKNMQEYKDDPYARAGSDTIETIEALYGVKPDGQDYENCIMEIAHPNSVIIAPSYDKINALVENNIERNRIMRNIALGMPPANLTDPKYAHKELVFELVRIANEMDSKNQEELYKLADACLVELSHKQQLTKNAIGWLVIAGIAAAVLGAGWLLEHTRDIDHGPLANCDRAIQKLTDLKTNSWYESDVDETVQGEVDSLIKQINKLRAGIVEFNKVIDLIYKPRTLDELKELINLKSAAKEHGDDVVKAVETFKHTVLEIEPMITQSIENFSSEVYQKQHTKPSILSEITGWFGEITHGRWGLMANDFISAVNALIPLKASVEELTKKLKDFDHVVAEYEEKIKAAEASLKEKEEASKPASAVPTSGKEESGKHLFDFIKNLDID